MARLFRLLAVGLALVAACAATPSRRAPAAPQGRDKPVDNSSLKGKVLCGYQGWFRCPGDATGMGWGHWSRDRARIAPDTLTFEMWPDLTEYAAAYSRHRVVTTELAELTSRTAERRCDSSSTAAASPAALTKSVKPHR